MKLMIPIKAIGSKIRDRVVRQLLLQRDVDRMRERW